VSFANKGTGSPRSPCSSEGGASSLGLLRPAGRRLAGARVEDHPGAAAAPVEVEEVGQAPRFGVERLVADPTEPPVVLREPQDRGLVGDGVIDEVALGPGRDGQERLTRTVATPVLVGAGGRG